MDFMTASIPLTTPAMSFVTCDRGLSYARSTPKQFWERTDVRHNIENIMIVQALMDCDANMLLHSESL